MLCLKTIKENYSKAAIAKAVVKYYNNNKRNLPWRQDTTPYGIWVSEIMLQQTQVKTVIPYFQNWMSVFPTVQSLAKSPLDDALALWSGLGYYRRCRHLHEGARQVVEAHGGVLPQKPHDLLKIKGVGRYTAGAIASIAFGITTPLVDGNVERVFSRLFAIPLEIKSSAGQKLMWQIAEWLVPIKKPSEYNQGLMELGATVCTPRSPACGLCPLKNHCLAHRKNEETRYPIKKKRLSKAQKQKLSFHALWVTKKNKFLMCQRNTMGLFPGMWELPHANSRGSLTSIFVESTEVQSKPLQRIEHQLSHRNITIRLHRGEIKGRIKLSNKEVFTKTKWISPQEITTIGITSAMKRLITTQLKTEPI